MTEKIIQVLSSVIKKTEAEVLALEKKNERYWDSLQTIEIVFCLEQEFGITIDSDDIPSLKSLGSIEEVVRRALKKS